MKTEARQEGRINTDRIIILQLSDGSSVQAQMVNLSIQGVGVCYPAEGDIGTHLTVVLPLSYGNEQQVVMVEGVIRHQHLRSNTYYFGIEFNELSNEQRIHILGFLKFKANTRNTI